jgi:UDP-N-acetylmuramoylalanine--D-glutamate ligase
MLSHTQTDQQPGAEAETVVVGLGATGLACARYFSSVDKPFRVVDSRDAPPALSQFKREFPEVSVALGANWGSALLPAKQLVVSPGVSIQTPAIKSAKEQGASITGDVDIFSQQVAAPIVAITGSNGKSTVCAMVASILKHARRDFALGGNLDGDLSKPVLDLLRESPRELYVLEVSSFQLETTVALNAEVASIINMSEDHLDRHGTMENYARAKQRIFNGCRKLVINRDDPRSKPAPPLQRETLTFGLGAPADGELGVIVRDGKPCLSLGSRVIIPVADLKIAGTHNIANALAAAAVALHLDVPMTDIAVGLGEFSGLAHRCQWVAERGQVAFYNDSKATNAASATAAVSGLGGLLPGKLVVILGGESKGDQTDALGLALKKFARALILIGRDADVFAERFAGIAPIHRAATMEEAVALGVANARPGDAVLLSPACASFDMFANFQERGLAFKQAVEALV